MIQANDRTCGLAAGLIATAAPSEGSLVMAVRGVSPLLHEGWLEFNRRKQRVMAHRLSLGRMDDASPEVETVFYSNRSGELVLPRLNPYLPFLVREDCRVRTSGKSQRWVELTSSIAEEMRTRTTRGQVALAPEVTDARPWSWAGLEVSVKYTCVMRFPFDMNSANDGVRRNIARCRRAGYRCERATDFRAAELCFRETEERQRFSYGIDARDLAELQELLGTERCRVYVAYSSTGEPASARVILWTAGGMAIDWLCGTRRAHLESGVTQALIQHVLSDVERSGALGFDFEGANIPNVAASKLRWGAVLVPYPVIESITIRNWLVLGVRAAKAMLPVKAPRLARVTSD
jgi:hypothetical protein